MEPLIHTNSIHLYLVPKLLSNVFGWTNNGQNAAMWTRKELFFFSPYFLLQLDNFFYVKRPRQTYSWVCTRLVGTYLVGKNDTFVCMYKEYPPYSIAQSNFSG